MDPEEISRPQPFADTPVTEPTAQPAMADETIPQTPETAPAFVDAPPVFQAAVAADFAGDAAPELSPPLPDLPPGPPLQEAQPLLEGAPTWEQAPEPTAPASPISDSSSRESDTRPDQPEITFNLGGNTEALRSDTEEVTPPHGDPLAVELTSPAPIGLGEPSGERSTPEALDAGSTTPPHGDPLSHLASESAPPPTPFPEFGEVSPPPVDAVPFQHSVSPDEAGLMLETAGDTTPEASGTESRSAAETLVPRSSPAVPPVTTVGYHPAQYLQPWAATPDGNSLESTSLGESAPGSSVRPDQYPVAGTLHPTVGAASPGQAVDSTPSPEERRESGPNWMLAFICAWSGVTSLFEAWAIIKTSGLRIEQLHNLGFVGYLLLGIGLVTFAVEALGWGKPRRSVALVLFPTVLTLTGVICLVLWNAPGRPI